MPPRVIIIVGPTASGKTSLSIALSKKLNGEVVSADSRQVYSGLDLGTGKVTKEEMDGVPHHLLDVAQPQTIYSAADFVRDAHRALIDITSRGKTPVVAGGTGFYVDALTGRIPLAPVPANASLRETLTSHDAPTLLALLNSLDPKRAARMNESDARNKVRLIRALEIAYCGTPKDVPPMPQYDYVWLGIKPNMTVLRKKIAIRLDERLEAGMVEEAKGMHTNGLSYERMETLGLEYRHLARFLQGTISYEEMRTQLEQKIWQYAKRQMTYWQRNKNIHWLVGDYENEALHFLN